MTADEQAAAGLDPARLRIQLSILLAAAEDLAEEWDATIELTEHLRTQRRLTGQDTSTTAVLADLEVLMRASAAFRLRAPVPNGRRADTGDRAGRTGV
jgi:hypothetical protein